jgi:3-mercaptopyruvate sulfurtransferase SseA
MQRKEKTMVRTARKVLLHAIALAVCLCCLNTASAWAAKGGIFNKLLISADDLQKKAGDPQLVILDARMSAGYDTAHIPGAISLKWGNYVTGPHKNLLPVADLETALGAVGLSRDKVYVIYDDTIYSWGAAGRVFWMLEYLGCTNVHILNGGWDKWVADGRPTQATINTLLPAVFTAQANQSIVMTTDRLNERRDDPDFAIIDCRTDEEYNGWQLYAEARGGHIPGAIQIPYAWFFNEDKTIKDTKQLTALFKSKGISKKQEVTAHCTKGIRSAFVYFILRTMGYKKCSNYDGSISEWSANGALPMEKLENFEKLVHPGWVKQVIDYHAPGSSSAQPPEYPYDRDHKYLIFETQWGPADVYLDGHVPGAIHSDSDIYENDYPRWFLLFDGDLHDAMADMGITEDTTVIVYSDSPIFAARLWWILMFAGVTDVRILNGGYQYWTANGLGGETTINNPTPATFTGSSVPDHIATTDYVFANYTDTATLVLADVRSSAEYIGNESGYRYLRAKGRIPNGIWAYDADDSSMIYRDSDNTLRSYTEIRDMWEQLGIMPDKEIIFYCGDGYRSALAFFYAYLMGFENIRNYSDGWKDWSTQYTEDAVACARSITPNWCQDPSGRPIAKGKPKKVKK